MKTVNAQWKVAAVLVLLCLIGGIALVAAPNAVAQTAVGTPTATPTPVQALVDVPDAVVRIRAIGDFYDPAEGAPTNAVGGTGFLIDPSGLVVTNNHVVAGARALQVFVPGEERPHSARILGLSECSDLALIQIAGAGYPYLAWAARDVEAGTPVHAAGYPGAEATVTRGDVVEIFTKSNSNLISVEREILHTAALAPGNSGGPLVNEGGAVVGVNFGESVGEQRFAAVPQSEAQAFLRQLRQAEPVTLGVNAVAWTEGSATGVWIAAVHPGSVADAAGLRAGDILVELDGVPLGANWTVEGFCDTVQAWDGKRPLPFRALTRGEQITGTLEPVPQQASRGSFGWLRTPGFDAVLPVAWTDTITEVDAETGAVTFAAAMQLGPNGGFEGSAGVSVTVRQGSASFNLQRILDSVGRPAPSCEPGERRPHQHTFGGVTYTGFYDEWTNCFAVNASFFVLAVQPENQEQLIFATFLALTQEDDRVFDLFRNSLQGHALNLEALPAGTPDPPDLPAVETPAAPPPATDATATVLVSALNVRGGPGTGFARIMGVGEGVVLSVRGRSSDCSWLAIVTPTGVWGWVSAATDYLSLSVPCDSLPVAQTATPSASAPLADETQGCIAFDNQLRARITATFATQEGASRTVTLAPGAQQTECFAPGAYTYTLEAPPPWVPVDGTLTLRAGDRYRLPIQEE